MTDLTSQIGTQARLAPRRNLRDEAADRLRALILQGTLAPGTPVPERDLAAALGISRTPLKEALRILETEWLISYGATGRPRVSDPDAATLTHVSDTLCALELAALEQVLDRGSDLAPLLQAQADLADLSPEASALVVTQADAAFHDALVTLSENPILIATHRRTQPAILRSRASALEKRKARKSLARDHDDLLQALSDLSPKRARRLLRSHLTR